MKFDKSTLYLLKESRKQEEYETEIRYLYKSPFSRMCSVILDNTEANYMYISGKYGAFEPKERRSPYVVTPVPSDEIRTWALLCSELIIRKCSDTGVTRVCFLYNEDTMAYTLIKSELIKKGIRIEEPLFKLHSQNQFMEWIKETSYNLVLQGIARAVGDKS
jgi:hypothetical protein